MLLRPFPTLTSRSPYSGKTGTIRRLSPIDALHVVIHAVAIRRNRLRRDLRLERSLALPAWLLPREAVHREPRSLPIGPNSGSTATTSLLLRRSQFFEFALRDGVVFVFRQHFLPEVDRIICLLEATEDDAIDIATLTRKATELHGVR